MYWKRDSNGSYISTPISFNRPVSQQCEHRFVRDDNLSMSHPEPGYADCTINVEVCRCGSRRHRVTGPSEKLGKMFDSCELPVAI